ncbi:hypothetical protein TNCV_1864931 [Trichonephila clavipes]|nr:hypothetical protein TNCV_1864931 [Trichonephila clavipes]
MSGESGDFCSSTMKMGSLNFDLSLVSCATLLTRKPRSERSFLMSSVPVDIGNPLITIFWIEEKTAAVPPPPPPLPERAEKRRSVDADGFVPPSSLLGKLALPARPLHPPHPLLPRLLSKTRVWKVRKKK